MESIPRTCGSVAVTRVTGSGATRSNRMTPCTAAPVLSAPVAGEILIVIPQDEAGEPKNRTNNDRFPNSPSIHGAIRLLEEHGYEVHRIASRNGQQGNLIATKGREDELLIAVIHSRTPVPDAKTLRSLFPGKVEWLCAYAKRSRYRVMIWIDSPVIGWRYYRVDIGGISYDWDFAKMMEE